MIHLNLVSVRLKAVKNIQKITKSMKMVAAAKYSRAERELKPAITYGGGATGKCVAMVIRLINGYIFT